MIFLVKVSNFNTGSEVCWYMYQMSKDNTLYNILEINGFL